MEVVTCQGCGMQYPAKDAFCPYCRFIRMEAVSPVPEKRGVPVLRLICGGALLTAVICLAVILASWNGSSEYRFLEPRTGTQSYRSESSAPSRSYGNSDSGAGGYSTYDTYDRSSAESRARSYLQSGSFSRLGLIKQLKYEGFSEAEAERVVDRCGADWNEQTLKTANSYLNLSGGFSEDGLRRQLKYEEFTEEQVSYAMNRCHADWNAQAAKAAQSYMRTFPDWTRSELLDQLKYEGFTALQASYGANSVR